VGLIPKPAPSDGISYVHHEGAARGETPSVSCLPHLRLYKHIEPGERPEEAQRTVLSILLAAW
jgi:hypothetical protein